jgi:type IV fimbrial biogenesis protein FimT
MKAKSAGFTLIELMVVLMLAAILLGLAAPSFSQFTRNARMSSSANGLLTAIHSARTEAIKRRTPVTVCASANPTANSPTCDEDGDFSGWIVFVDDDGDPDTASGDEGNGTFESDSNEILLRTSAAPPDGITVLPSTVYIQFGANGFQRRDEDAAPTDISIRMCDSRGSRSIGSSGSAARLVEVSRTGRPQVSRDETAIKALGGCPADD